MLCWRDIVEVTFSSWYLDVLPSQIPSRAWYASACAFSLARFPSFLLLPMKYLLFLPMVSLSIVAQANEPVQFARDVSPILSANCFACHGPDEHERQADLRLDVEADAKKKHGGTAAIVPGSIDASEIITRMTSTDPDQVMPPPSSKRTVKPEQLETLRRWIADGAKWQRHWSFEPIVKPAGSLDDQVTAELAKNGLRLQQAAAKEVLARRLSLDLIGLPSTPEAADAFANDTSADAYERFVDTLLERPQFGEHWARMWLDLARYADTKGYEKDLGRTMWPYRDWVIQALNADMSLEQFTVEQLAGDLLTNPTDDQLIATAFHRNTMSNDEGGTDDEEFRSVAVKDRIDTTVQVWMGLTMGCAKCHSHKYDPISNEEYYKFYALFNQTEDADRPDDAPRMQIANESQRAQQERLVALVKEAEAKVKDADAKLTENEVSRWQSLKVLEATANNGGTFKIQSNGALLARGKASDTDVYVVTGELASGRHTALRLEAMLAPFPDGAVGVGRNPKDPNFVVSELLVESLEGEQTRSLQLKSPRADFEQNGWPVTAAIDGNVKTGWAVSPRQREPHVAMLDFAEPLEFTGDLKVRITLNQNYGDRLVLSQFRLSTSGADPQTLTPSPESAETRKVRDDLAAAQKSLSDFEATLAMLPIMRELPPEKQRTTKIHKRGNFLDPGDVVTADVLTEICSLPENAPLNRLGMAKWLVDSDNPLTPRVWANRIWARLFGQGIVETEEDFGALGSPPSNPQLLEWLAAEYRDGGWSLKKLIKTIVMSDTYRQSSTITSETRSADPRNTLMSRGSRYRLSAEVLRDQSLAVAGLLSLRQGGPAVMPPQPAGLWRSTYNGLKWVDAEDEDRFRRAVYTYLKRTTPYPSLTTFDAGSGEVCQVRRIRTNTPLQALVTMNDPVYLESAAALAQRMITEVNTPESRAARGLRLALIRPLRDGETAPLVRLQRETQLAFESDPEQATALIKSSRSGAGEMPASEFAAWIITANAILNLDEFLSRN